MNYNYRAYNEKGEVVTGLLDGLNEHDVIEKLGAKNLVLVELKLEAPNESRQKRRKLKVPLPVLAGFTRQMATMLRAGLPLLRCLDGMGRQTKNKNLQTVLRDLQEVVEGGDSLSDAMKTHPAVFTPVYIAMVRAGENGGIMPDVLARLASYLEMSLRLRQRVRSAMMYPVIVSVMGLGICLFMITVIIPQFEDIFKELNHQLPLPTLILITVSDWVRNHLLICLALAVAFGWAVRHTLRTKAGRQVWDRLKLRLPVIGPLVSKIAFARFCRTFSSLMHSGVPVLKTLEITTCAVGNVVIESSIAKVGTSIEAGATLRDAMSSQPLFPPMMLEMVAAGEQTGCVDEMLAQVADYYDQEVETTLAGLTALLEPLLILFLGVVVGSIVIAMFLPIFKMTDAVQF